MRARPASPGANRTIGSIHLVRYSAVWRPAVDLSANPLGDGFLDDVIIGRKSGQATDVRSFTFCRAGQSDHFRVVAPSAGASSAS
jgi:hypothetical protein